MSKGPAMVRYRMIMTEQASFNFALNSGNDYLACLKLRGIAHMIPMEFKPTIPKMPEEIFKQVKEKRDNDAIKRWIDKWQELIFADVNRFIEESYLKGELDPMT